MRPSAYKNTLRSQKWSKTTMRGASVFEIRCKSSTKKRTHQKSEFASLIIVSFTASHSLESVSNRQLGAIFAAMIWYRKDANGHYA